MKRSVIALLLVASLAGCIAGDDAGSDSVAPHPMQMPQDPMMEGDGHDHADPAQHRVLWNYDVTDHDPLQATATDFAGLHALDAQAGYLFGAVYGSHAAAANGGLAIWDLADPSHPVHVGHLTLPGSVGGDRSMEATQDGDFVVLSTEFLTCFGQVNPLGEVTAYLIDARDKTAPVVADVQTFTGQTLGSPDRTHPLPLPLSLGEHSVTVHRIGDADYAFIFGQIYRIERDSVTPTLVFVNEIGLAHDLFLEDTPDGKVWGLAANGNNGFVLWDLTDPAMPTQLGQWDIPDRDQHPDEYYIHTADAAFTEDGHAVIVITSEDWGDYVSPFWVFDATDVEQTGEMTLVGTWGNPGNHTAAGMAFSQHNPRFHDGGILTLSHYHGGLWQFDLRDPASWARPPVIATALWADDGAPTVRDPAEKTVEEQVCGLGEDLAVPNYMDVAIGEGGVLYAADVTAGLYTFTPTEEHPVYGAYGL